MAIATLKELYGNKEVLHRNVKIRRGKTAKYFISISNFDQTKKEFVSILQLISKQTPTQALDLLISKSLNHEKV
jgi:farnesyl-diphosphate farnesyltransferase